MAYAVCFACASPVITPNKSSNSTYLIFPKSQEHSYAVFGFPPISKSRSIHPLRAKNEGNGKTAKVNSIVCAECDGNGAKVCSQCEGNGVNIKEHFNGKFKVGGLCWLCRGKRDILCGNCNGAGFLGGFLSTFDD